MSFETPGALWGLLTLALLALFSLWRQAAARTVVPSLLLWKKIPERNPPLRALRRPRWRIDLLFQALAVTCLVLALAGPYVASSRPKPRRVALVLDTSARMLAGGKWERARREAARWVEEKLSGDEVAFYASDPSPRRAERLEEIRPVHAHVDLGPLLAVARSQADEVVVFSDRPVEGAHLRLLAGPAGNVGIVEFTAAEDELFARVVNYGPPRSVRVRWSVDGEAREEERTLESGVSAWSRRGDFRKARRVSVEVRAEDGFALDDRGDAVRLEPDRIVVSLSGQRVPPLERALRAAAGVELRYDGGAGQVAIGVDEEPPAGELRVRIHPPRGALEGEAVVARHPLMEGLERRAAEELVPAGVGELPAGAREGEPLLVVGGRRAAAIRGREVHLSIDCAPDRWPATVSFPIFWANVIDFARRGASGWKVFRTGRPVELPAEARIVDPSGRESAPSRTFLGYEVGEYVLRFADGERRIRTSLLDERESDTAGEARDLDWNPADPAGREPLRRSLAGLGAAAALGFLALAWLAQARGD